MAHSRSTGGRASSQGTGRKMRAGSGRTGLLAQIAEERQ